MGFLDFLGKLFSNVGGGSAIKDWEENMTLEDIEAMEKQGCDMTEYRKKHEELKAQKAAIHAADMAVLDFAKLAAFNTTPRDVNSQFLTDCMTLNDDKPKKYAEVYAKASILYAAVVQANNMLWEPDDNEYTGMVVVFSTDPNYMQNGEWLNRMAQDISEMKAGRRNISADNEKFIKKLRNDKSEFCCKLGNSLTNGVDAWCATYTLPKQEALPLKKLPANKLLPLLLMGTPSEGAYARLRMIDAKYYTK